jgi:hypothetical protein
LGIDDESQYCVLFGHDEPNDRVLEILRKTARNLDRIIQEGRFVILRRESSAAEAVFSKAVDKGATAIRYLTTLEWDRLPYPAGEPTG